MILPWLISHIVLLILSGNHCDHIGLKKIDIFPVLGHPCLKDHKLKKIILSVICKMFTVPLVCGEAGSGESSGPLLFVDGACLLEGVCTVWFPHNNALETLVNKTLQTVKVFFIVLQSVEVDSNMSPSLIFITL